MAADQPTCDHCGDTYEPETSRELNLGKSSGFCGLACLLDAEEENKVIEDRLDQLDDDAQKESFDDVFEEYDDEFGGGDA